MPRRSAENERIWLEHGIDVPGKTLYLKGGVDDDMLDVATSALHLFGQDSDVLILLNSGGGDTFAGLAIYDLLQSHTGEVTVRVVGMAASMACVILQGGDVRQATRNSVLMHHVGTKEFVSDHAKNVERMVKFSASHDERIDQIMLNRVNEHMVETGQPQLSLAQWRHRDTWDQWLFPEQAIATGLLDEMWP